MQTTYKERILKEIDKVPDEKMGSLYRIIHLLTTEIALGAKKTGRRVSLRGIRKGSRIDDSLLDEAKKSLFP